MKVFIRDRFGTWRGFIRALLGYGELIIGRLNRFHVHEPRTFQRLVFVCLGNICRSAFAEKVAVDLGLHAVSVGLSTTTGAASPTSAIECAQRNGIDLTSHKATDWADFEVFPGDLFLVMEIRQARELQRRLMGNVNVEIALIGLWCTPALPHIHDPYTLSAEYFDTCFLRIREAVYRLSQSVSLPTNTDYRTKSF